MVESDFSWVTYLIAKVRNRFDVVSLVTAHSTTRHSKHLQQTQGISFY